MLQPLSVVAVATALLLLAAGPARTRQTSDGGAAKPNRPDPAAAAPSIAGQMFPDAAIGQSVSLTGANLSGRKAMVKLRSGANQDVVPTDIRVEDRTVTQGIAMLTDEEKDHIRHEEIFRQEVRFQLEQNSRRPSSIWKNAWAIANTSFGIWLLSTVVIGLFTWSYTRWEQTRAKERQTADVIRKLDTEIASRLEKLEASLDSVSTARGHYLLMRSLGKPDESDPGAEVIFPEFQNRSLSSLMWELVQLVPKEEKTPVNSGLKALQRLTAINYQGRPSRNENAPLDLDDQRDMKEIREAIRESLKITRWSTSQD